jgi:hypothetical protein
MLIVLVGNPCYIIIQKNTTCLSLLGWTQHIKFIFFTCSFMDLTLFFFYMSSNRSTISIWVHTEYIKLPAPIEYIFVTPSHHRVHHSTNDKYLEFWINTYYLGQNIWDFSSRGRANSLWHYNANKFI